MPFSNSLTLFLAKKKKKKILVFYSSKFSFAKDYLKDFYHFP